MIDNMEKALKKAFDLIKKDKRRLYINIIYFEMLLPLLEKTWDVVQGDMYYFKGLEVKFDIYVPKDAVYIMEEEFAEELRERERGIFKDNPLVEFTPPPLHIEDFVYSRRMFLGEWIK